MAWLRKKENHHRRWSQPVDLPFALLGEGKRRYLYHMFSALAPRYDALNNLFSLRQHAKWRRAAVDMAKLQPNFRVLDLACGTGDMLLECASRLDASGQICGLDFSEPMLLLAREKTARVNPPCHHMLIQGDMQALPIASNTFDVVTVAFGLRNAVSLEGALAEIVRVLKPGGRLVVLEFNRPRKRLPRLLTALYTNAIVPVIGRVLSGGTGYSYLPASVRMFPGRRKLAEQMHLAGLRGNVWRDLTLGAVCIHSGTKPAQEQHGRTRRNR